MPNWSPITEDDLKSYILGGYIDQARTLASGANDPVAEIIADAVAAVRAAVSTGNVLDADPTKVPNSLRGLTARRACFALLPRIGVDLSKDQQDARAEDRSRLNRISDNEVEVEKADNPAEGNAEMQTGPAVDVIRPQRQQTGRHNTSGL